MSFFSRNEGKGQYKYQYSLPSIFITIALVMIASVVLDYFIYRKDDKTSGLWQAVAVNLVPKMESTPIPVVPVPPPDQIRILADKLKEKYFQSGCDAGISYTRDSNGTLIVIKGLKPIFDGKEASQFDKDHNKVSWKGEIAFWVEQEYRIPRLSGNQRKGGRDDSKETRHKIMSFPVEVRNGKVTPPQENTYHAPGCQEVMEIKKQAGIGQ